MIPRNRVNNSSIYNELEDAFRNVVLDEQYIHGSNVPTFEEEFCKKFGNKHGVLCANTTVGIELIMRSLDIQMSLMTDAAYIGIWLGAFRDTEAITLPPYSDYTWDVKTRAYIRYLHCHSLKKTAVIISHLYGSKACADISAIKEFSENTYVIEDMSQSHGIPPHPETDAVIYSLYPTKPFGGLSDGCIITTNNDELAKKLKSNSFYGYDAYADISMESSNYKVDELNAAFLLTKLRTNKFEEELCNRNMLAQIYKARLLKLSTDLIYVPEFSVDCVYHMMPIYVKNRSDFVSFMEKRDIEVGHHYPLSITAVILKVPTMSPWNQHVVTLPLSAWHTKEEINTVCDAITEYCLETSKCV